MTSAWSNTIFLEPQLHLGDMILCPHFQVGVPFSLLGMVFLAVGNSMGDFANNMAMAKRGIPGMVS